MARVFDSLLLHLNEKGKEKDSLHKMEVDMNDRRRVETVFYLLDDFNIEVNSDREIKSQLMALDCRIAANKVYQNSEDLDTVVELYTKSIAFSPEGSEELALAYGNRSAVLIKVRLFAEALKDIARALDGNFPQKLRPKLLARRLVCLRCLGAAPEDIEKADEELKKCLAELGDSEAPQIPDDVGSPRILLEDDRTDFQAVDANANGISSAVAVAYTEKYGNHLVATRDIQPGEILIVEPFYACTLKESNRFHYCDYCFKRTWSAIPCRKCVSVIYCSETCRESAWNAYHDIECDVIDVLICNRVSINGHLSLRLTIQALKQAGSRRALEYAIELAGNINENTQLIGIDDYTKYTNVYCLKKHTSHRRPIDLLAIATEACVILYILSAHTNVLEDEVRPDWCEFCDHEFSLCLAGLIMSYTQISMVNCRDVVQMGKTARTPDRGPALLPFSSLMNHSCTANTVNCSAGRKFVVAACDFIAKGDQVFDSYEPHHALMPKAERQKLLSEQYFFQCDCDACVNDWPSYNDTAMVKIAQLSATTRLKFINVHEKIVKLEKIMRSGIIDNPDEVLNDLRMLSKTLDQYFDRPTRESMRIVGLFSAFFYLQGNRWQSINF